jgi:ribosome biogenesis protein MAK21
MLLNLAGVSTVNGGHASQTNERVANMGAEALTDLFSSTLLPTNRKLVGLESRPLYQYEESQDSNQAKKTISPRILLLWRYEEIMRNKYAAFLTQYLGKTLSQTSTSAESLSKVNALRTACQLLKEIPEGEQMLLSLVVNKVGDPTKKIASAAGHELRKMLDVHPNMTAIIAREVSSVTMLMKLLHMVISDADMMLKCNLPPGSTIGTSTKSIFEGIVQLYYFS